MIETDPSYHKSDIPEGRSGDWTLERFVVKDDPSYDPAKDPRPAFSQRRPGTYTLLRRGEIQFMTDLYDEWWTQRLLIEEARQRGGRLLVSGLGLGMILESIFRSPEIKIDGITVLEFSPDVIRLVAPHLKARYGDRLEIIEADVFKWQPPPGARFSAIWHDIWPSPYDVEDEVEQLRRRYEPYGDWVGSWPEEHLASYVVMS